jgi:hypothetical protein
VLDLETTPSAGLKTTWKDPASTIASFHIHNSEKKTALSQAMQARAYDPHYRSLAGFRTTFFWGVSAPLSTLVHFDNPTCDKCSQKRPIIASRIIGR